MTAHPILQSSPPRSQRAQIPDSHSYHQAIDTLRGRLKEGADVEAAIDGPDESYHVCGNCEVEGKHVVIYCEECDLELCKKCHHLIHKKSGKRADHETRAPDVRQPIETLTLTAH